MTGRWGWSNLRRGGYSYLGHRWVIKQGLTCEGDVTFISGTNASSNRLMMFSCLRSLDGVTLGGGGTGGPGLSCSIHERATHRSTTQVIGEGETQRHSTWLARQRQSMFAECWQRKLQTETTHLYSKLSGQLF